MKRFSIYVLVICAGLLNVALSCQREELLPEKEDIPEGFVNLSFVTQVQDPETVITRSVDPDGGGVQYISLFCFDSYGLFITTVTAQASPDEQPGGISLSGHFTANIPDHAEYIHVIGNQNLTDFKEDRYRNMSEAQVMTTLEASAGRMIYWARTTAEDLMSNHRTPETALGLLRNQAKITVEVADGTDFHVSGYILTNTSAFGTVAPYNEDKGGFVAPMQDNPFVTLAVDRSLLGDFVDVRNNEVEYVFETENSIDDPVNVIIKGTYGDDGQEKYYRVMMLDEAGENIMLLRNHHYKVTIDGELSYGQDNFQSALSAPATNNVWITVSEDVNEIVGLDYILSVDRTNVVVDEGQFLTPNTLLLHYNIERVDGRALTADDMAEVYWSGENDVAYNAFTHTFDPSTGKGSVLVTLHQMGGENKREGRLIVKKGRLHRAIKVITIKRQTFEPAWVTTNVYGHGVGEKVTMMFTISEDCPQELFPFNVLLSSDILDVRSESGMTLPLVFEGEDGYGASNGIGYKYVLRVTEPGVQRVYFETILEQKEGGSTDVTIEAEHFASLTKRATFSNLTVDQRVLVHNLSAYSAGSLADDVIYYYLVPQKVNAVVEFYAHLGVVTAWNPDHTVADYDAVTPTSDDEFLLYSRYLDHVVYADGSKNDFMFYPVDKDKWSTGGRVYGFKRNMSAVTPVGQGAIFHMLTNSSRSEEVIRIASNPVGAPSVTGSGYNTSGQQFRSAIFELANYRPFRFYASVSRNGTRVIDDQIDIDVPGSSVEENESVLSWDYKPGDAVEIEFDVTSYMANDGVSVDPFGTEFDIYIDAPMLRLDNIWLNEQAGAADKVSVEGGRFVYHVDADRDVERQYFEAASPVVRTDAALPAGHTQTGERKMLRFIVDDIVSAGDIVISSEVDSVVFFSKKFTVENNSINGRILYIPPGTSDPVAVPYESFVSFERTATYNRIGTISVTGNDGSFALRLRKEYNFGWNNDQVKFQYADRNGTLYECFYDGLNQIYDDVRAGKPVILRPVGGSY